MDDKREITIDLEEGVIVGKTTIKLLDVHGGICKLGFEGSERIVRGELLETKQEQTTKKR